METRKIGSLSVSAVGLGCNNFGARMEIDAAVAVVNAALDNGVTYFDTADVYGNAESEVVLGKALGGRRDQVVLATKFGMLAGPDGLTGGDPKWVPQAAEDSLRRLGTDRIDHYQLHAPDPTIPLAETMGALNQLVIEGKVLEIGCSNFDAELLDESASIAAASDGARFSSVQNRFSVLHREPEPDVIDSCRRNDMSLVPFYPLESGLLTGKIAADGTAPEGSRIALMEGARLAQFIDAGRLEAVDRLQTYAADHGRTLIELAFGWILSEPAVASVIAGATKPEQVVMNVAAAEWRMSAEQREEISALAG